MAPMLIAAVGILLSIIGIFSCAARGEDAWIEEPPGSSLSAGTNVSSVLIRWAPPSASCGCSAMDNWM